MEVYKKLKQVHVDQSEILNKRYNLYSVYRLVLALVIILSIYFYNQTTSSVILLCIFILIASFFVLLKFHQRIAWNKNLEQALAAVNSDELEFLSGNSIPFKDGAEFIDPSHTYSYDLDFFGKKSFYQHINRTATFKGSQALASDLLSIKNNRQIIETQLAIQELTSKIEWRQRLFALGRLKQDSSETVEQLLSWSQRPISKESRFLLISSWLTPSLTIISLLAYFFTPIAIFGNIGLLLFIANSVILGTRFQQIRQEIIPSTSIDKILRQYALIIAEIEGESFNSPLLIQLQSQLKKEGHGASKEIHTLSKLFSRMDLVQNIFGGPILNGLFLYHIHQLRFLNNWRSKYAGDIENWLQILGKFEVLNSWANFLMNNPSFSFPSINEKGKISFENLGHPLIDQPSRIANSISFNDHHFFILTGSNMSGKSTFLRTLGINMVLAGIGAPICASAADVYPLPVLVSMRLSDSLSDHESYFMAEIKRLKSITDQLNESKHFVLLDEILRGTNSDDKRTGTVGMIENMVQKQAIGAIATHDLEVCNIANKYPDTLTNLCFEVEMKNGQLVFDYKLRSGVCQNKSATFLMEQMDII